MSAAIRWSFLLSVAVLAACGEKGSAPPPVTEATSQAEASTPPATGNVVEVKAITDDKGSRFEPSEVTVTRGDVLRLTLVSGVHNVSFPAEANSGAAGLPAPSDMLQLPGQTLDVPVTFAAGSYTMQCDPHAALGMTGKLEVKE